MSSPALDYAAVFARMRTACDLAGGQRRWAEAHGIKPSVVCDVLNAHRPPPASVLAALGLRRRTVFEDVRGTNV